MSKFFYKDVGDGDYFVLFLAIFSEDRPKVYFSYDNILYQVIYSGECKNQLCELTPEQIEKLNLKPDTSIVILGI